MEGRRISPIVYIEARCDQCNDEIYSGLGAEFAVMRNGDLNCKACKDSRPDEVLKNYSMEATVILGEPEVKPETPEDEPKEFPCHVCGFPAKSRAGLNSHVFHKHGREEVLKISEEAPEDWRQELPDEIPEALDDAEVVAEEPDAIDRASKERIDRRC